MDIATLRQLAADYLADSPDNFVQPEDAIRPELANMRIYDAPLIAVGNAADPLFMELKDPKVVDPDTWLPTDWLPEARTVISYFLPFTAEVRESNRQMGCPASDQWLHARVEGQIMVDSLGKFIMDTLAAEGCKSVYPTTDPRLQLLNGRASSWSERHVGYVCGLGTFGLSRGLITEKGMAGRIGSVITDAPLEVTARAYKTAFEYCTMCGKCAKNCPVEAIDPQRGVADGKDNNICRPYVQSTYLPPHGPHARKRYGCGKCQVAVPCESKIPGRK